MFLGWSPTGILVIPGKSIKVRSGQVQEKIVKIIGSSMIFLVFPALSSVHLMIISLTSSKFVYLVSFPSNTAYGFVDSEIWTRRSSKGRLVQTPSLRGKKFSPTIDSRTELLPDDWAPNVTIRGRRMYKSKILFM